MQKGLMDFAAIKQHYRLIGLWKTLPNTEMSINERLKLSKNVFKSRSDIVPFFDFLNYYFSLIL